MIIEDTVTYPGLIRRYSDRDVMIANERGDLYDEAVDPVSIPRAYTETDVQIETDGEGLIARMPGYRLVTDYPPETPTQARRPAQAPPGPQGAPAAPEQPGPQSAQEDARIAELEAQIAAIREGRA